jgi:hypothetical protein
MTPNKRHCLAKQIDNRGISLTSKPFIGIDYISEWSVDNSATCCYYWALKGQVTCLRFQLWKRGK